MSDESQAVAPSTFALKLADSMRYMLEHSYATDADLARVIDREIAAAKPAPASRVAKAIAVAILSLEYAHGAASDRGWVMDLRIYENALAKLRAESAQPSARDGT